MTATYKVLGQQAPGASTNTTLYTVPASTQVVVSTLTICNRSGASVQYRVAVRPAGAAITNAHYVAYDAVISANDTVALTLGISLAATDVVTVYASTVDLTFNLYGCELT